MARPTGRFKRDSASDTRLNYIRCPTCGLANMRGQPLCGHCKTPLPRLEELQQAIDESPKLQQLLQSIRRSQRRRKKLKKMYRAVTGAEKPDGFYVALAVIPGLGHMARREWLSGWAYFGTVVFLMVTVSIFLDQPMKWLPLAVAALVHTYSVCALLGFKPPNGHAAVLLTFSILAILTAGIYVPSLIFMRRLAIYDELGRVPVSGEDEALFGFALLASIVLCGLAAMASAYYSAKSRQIPGKLQ